MNSSVLQRWIICVLSGLAANLAHADTYFTWKTAEGESHRLHIREGKTRSGAFQVRVTNVYDPLPGVLPREALAMLEPLILVGRDTNKDGRPDLWFSIGNDGIRSVLSQEPEDRLGTDVMKKLLAEGLAADFKQTVRQVYRVAIGPFLMAIAVAEQDYERYLDAQMVLIQAEMHVDQLKSSGRISGAVAEQAYARIQTEWTKNWKQFRQMSRGGGFWANSAADVALYFTMTKGLKWLGTALENGAHAIAGTGFYESVSAGARRIANRFGQIVEGSVKRLDLKRAQALVAPAKSAGKKAAQDVAKKVVPEARGLVMGVVQGVRKDLVYISMSQSIQVLVETSARWGDYSDPNPVRRLGKIVTDKDFLQNFLYMSNETILTNGLLNHMQARSFVTKMFAMGVVSFIDSSIMSYCIKDGVDPARATFDTAWEIGVGNTQTVVDNVTREQFRKLAETSGNPRLAWFGYGVNLLDQALGYYLYNAAAKYFEHNPQAFDQFMQQLDRAEKAK